MPTIAHKNLTGTNLHEPKGADAAAVDKVYVSNGAGSGAWQKITADQLETTGNPFGAQLLHVQDQKASGTDGGTFTSGAWRTRTLNTEVTNEITSASLASDQITLPAGTYFISAFAPAGTVLNHKAKLYNVTDASDTLLGTTEYSTNSASIITKSTINGRFTIADTKVFEVQHRCNTSKASTGLGFASNFSVIEIYTDVMIWKVG